jgi:transposase
MDSSWGHDLRWLFVSRGSRRPDRLGAGRLGGASVGSARFEAGGGARHLAQAQEEPLKAWIAATLPRSTRDVGAYISQAFGVVYESCARVIALLHRLGLEYRKPEVIGRKLDAKSSRRL